MNSPGSGVRLGGRYRLVRQIAVGGMGEVWVAHDESLARDVAAKVLRPEFAGNTEFLGRLRTEARNAASLSHPNIAQLYDYGEQEGLGYLVMELITGEPMSDLLERSPVLPLDRLLPILSQTARALHAAHVSGVVHRDVKPGNILLERSGTVKITDFGVSLAANQVPMTATGMVMGTAQYLSPEQAIGRPATPSSDIYALGVIAFEATVGRRPFTGKSPVDIAVAHVNEPVPALPSSVPPEFAALIARMLAKEPSDRPRSSAQLSRTLDQLADKYRQHPWLGATGVGQPTSGGARPSSGARRTAPTPPSATPRSPAESWASGQPGSTGNQTSRPRSASQVRPRSASQPGQGSVRRSTSRSATSSAEPARPPVRASQRRTSTTTGQRVGSWSWQSIVLTVLVTAVIIAAMVGLFGGNNDKQGTRSLAPIELTATVIASGREECALASSCSLGQTTSVRTPPNTAPTTPKDV